MNDRDKILSNIAGATQSRADRPLPRPYCFTENSDQPLIERFRQAAQGNGINVYEADYEKEIPDQVLEAYRQLLNQGPALVSPELCGFSWSPEKSFVFGKNDGSYLVGISLAQAAVAQTGALVLCNRQTNPSSISFLSRYHVVILYEADIVESMTDVWNLVMPGKHAIHFISGPSSTADIGGLMLTGVHGPETLLCFIIRSERRDNPFPGKPR